MLFCLSDNPCDNRNAKIFKTFFLTFNPFAKGTQNIMNNELSKLKNHLTFFCSFFFFEMVSAVWAVKRQTNTHTNGIVFFCIFSFQIIMAKKPLKWWMTCAEWRWIIIHKSIKVLFWHHTLLDNNKKDSRPFELRDSRTLGRCWACFGAL